MSHIDTLYDNDNYMGNSLVNIHTVSTVDVRQCGPVVRALALRSGDPRFKTHSDHSLNRAPVAQLVEHRAVTREVVSSTPAGPTLRVFK